MRLEVSPMDVGEDVMAQLADWAEECREHHRRIKEAGDQVTEAEKVEARASYEASSLRSVLRSFHNAFP